MVFCLFSKFSTIAALMACLSGLCFFSPHIPLSPLKISFLRGSTYKVILYELLMSQQLNTKMINPQKIKDHHCKPRDRESSEFLKNSVTKKKQPYIDSHPLIFLENVNPHLTRLTSLSGIIHSGESMIKFVTSIPKSL